MKKASPNKKQTPSETEKNGKKRRSTSNSRQQQIDVSALVKKKLKQKQQLQSISKGSKESTSSAKKSTSSESGQEYTISINRHFDFMPRAYRHSSGVSQLVPYSSRNISALASYIVSEIEVGMVKKNLKSRPPSSQSINTLKTRVRRRELEMKKRWGLPIVDEADMERKSTQTVPTALVKQEKPVENYRQVFPEIKLNFMRTDQSSPDPSPSTTPLHGNVSEQLADDVAMKKSPNRITRRDEFSSESPTRSITSSAHNVKDTTSGGEDGRSSLSLSIDPTPSGSLMVESTPHSFAEMRPQSSIKSSMVPTQFGKRKQTLSITGLPFIKNKDNHGRLFVNGLPFWVDQIREDITDEENVLNSAVIFDVASRKLSLVNMPDENIVLDIYADCTVLQSRDAKCFSKDVLLGNTMRSMANLLDVSEFEESIEARKALGTKINVLNIVDPTTIVFYMVTPSPLSMPMHRSIDCSNKTLSGTTLNTLRRRSSSNERRKVHDDVEF